MAAPSKMNVDNFKANFDGGSRPNRYMVSGILGPTGKQIDASTTGLLCRATSMPAVTVGIMRVPFRGRVVKIPGDRTYEEWTCTFYDTFATGTRAGAYNEFWKWNAGFNDHPKNIPGPAFAVGSGVNLDSSSTMFRDWTVGQLDMLGDTKRHVVMKSAWPTVVSEIALTYDSSDTIAEFTVTFAYDWLEGGVDLAP